MVVIKYLTLLFMHLQGTDKGLFFFFVAALMNFRSPQWIAGVD